MFDVLLSMYTLGVPGFFINTILLFLKKKKICQPPRLNRRTYLGPIQQMKFLSHLPNHSKENSFGVVQYDSLHPPELGKKKEDKLVNWIEYFLTR